MIRILLVIFIGVCAGAGAQKQPPVEVMARPMPFYLREFLRSMGVDPRPYELEANYNHRIAESIKAAGTDAVLNCARAALDQYSGSKYFLVKETDRYILVGRRYAVFDALITIEIFFYKDMNGNIDRVMYTDGSMG